MSAQAVRKVRMFLRHRNCDIWGRGQMSRGGTALGRRALRR